MAAAPGGPRYAGPVWQVGKEMSNSPVVIDPEGFRPNRETPPGVQPSKVQASAKWVGVGEISPTACPHPTPALG